MQLTMHHTFNPPHRTGLRFQAGSSLLEVLIAMGITATSLLGLAALQIKIQQEQRISEQRVNATSIASSYLEGLRGNFRYARDGNASFTFSQTSTLPNTPTDCAAQACSAAEIDNNQRYAAFTAIRSKLVEGGMDVTWTSDDIPGGTPLHPILGVTLIWREPDTLATAIDPQCANAPGFTNTAGYRCVYLSTTL